MAQAPKTFNFFINQPWMRKLSESSIGMVDLLLLSTPSLKQRMVGHRSANMTLEQLETLSAEQKAKMVLVDAGSVHQLLRLRRWWPDFVRTG